MHTAPAPANSHWPTTGRRLGRTGGPARRTHIHVASTAPHNPTTTRWALRWEISSVTAPTNVVPPAAARTTAAITPASPKAQSAATAAKATS